jgi:hypothetical protein
MRIHRIPHTTQGLPQCKWAPSLRIAALSGDTGAPSGHTRTSELSGAPSEYTVLPYPSLTPTLPKPHPSLAPASTSITSESAQPHSFGSTSPQPHPNLTPASPKPHPVSPQYHPSITSDSAQPHGFSSTSPQSCLSSTLASF